VSTDTTQSVDRESATRLAERTDHLERFLETEHARATSLNIRATALAGTSAIAILLLAQFSATWLDDNSWTLADEWDTALRYLLPGTVAAFALATGFALCALWPRTSSKAARSDRIDSLAAGDDEKQAALILKMVESLRKTNDLRNLFVRVASLAFALALAGTISQSTIFAVKAEPADAARPDTLDTPDEDQAGLPSADEQQELAESYAPRVWLHSAERTGPMEPSSYIAASRLGWHVRRTTEKVASEGSVVTERLGRNCLKAPEGCYEMRGYRAYELTRPYAKHALRPLNLLLRRGFTLDVDDSARQGQSRRNPDAPVFFEFRRARNKLLLTYWFFYGYSRPHVAEGLPGRERLAKLLSHEGDWESIEVALSPDGTKPLDLYLYGHGRPTRVAWANVFCTADTDRSPCRLDAPGHPIVYSALESHASYAEAGSTKVCGSLGCARDLRNEGWRWDTWSADDSVRSVRVEPWYGFGGAWGAVGTVSDTTGPLGPRAGKLPADPDPEDLVAVGG
jgi:hypothetical protein